MWSSRVRVVALVVFAVSCGGRAPPSGARSRWAPPAILTHVPADSPYVFASLAPIPERQRQRMLRGFDRWVAELVRSAEQLRGADRASLTPWTRAGLAVADELRGKPADQWWRSLGFAPGGRFVLYGLSLWPVLRVEVADPARLRGVITRVTAAAGTQPNQASLDGRPYWSAKLGDFTIVAAVLEREAVIALVPQPALAAALPLVLATRPPTASLRTTTTVGDLLGRHHFMGLMIAYLDVRRAVELAATTRPTPLEAPLQTWIGPISPACRADLDRLVAIAPRVVFGYRRLDDAGFQAAGIVEAPARVRAELARLGTSVPEVIAPLPGQPLLALGAAVNPEQLVTWARGLTDQLRAHPFVCPWLTGINRASDQIASRLAASLPPALRSLRGFSLVIEDATVMPMNIDGHLLLVGAPAAELVTWLAGMVPAIASVTVPPDGRPVELPTQGLPALSAHVARTADRLVIVTGPDSARRATHHLAAPVPPGSPLVTSAFNASRLRALTSAFGGTGPENISYLGNVGMAIGVTTDGVSLDVWGTWENGPAAAERALP